MENYNANPPVRPRPNRPPPRRGGTRGLTLIELVVVTGVLSILLGLVFAGIAPARRSARQVQCAHTLRAWGHGILTYASSMTDMATGSAKGAGQMPPYYVEDPTSPLRGKSFEDLLRPFLGSGTEVLGCPQASKMKGSFKMNQGSLNTASKPDRGKNLTNVKNPLTTVLLFEGDENDGKFSDEGQRLDAVVFRHPGNRANILYAEGHVVARTRQELAEADQDVALAYGPAAPDGWTLGSNDSNEPPPLPGPDGEGTPLPKYLPPVIDLAAFFPANPVPLSGTAAFNCQATDPEGLSLTFEWDFGDGSAKAAAAGATHAYGAWGKFYPTVTVTNSKGLKAQKVLTLTSGIPPAITGITGFPDPLAKKTTYAFQAQISNPDNAAVEVKWSWGDGTTDTGWSAANVTRNNSYANATPTGGTYVLKALLRYGPTGNKIEVSPYETQVTVQNGAPSLLRMDVTPSPAFVGDDVDIKIGTTAAYQTDPDGDPTDRSYAIEDAAGNPVATGGDVTTFAHRFAAPGTYTITGKIVDNDANNPQSATRQATLTVQPNAPPANATLTLTALAGRKVRFDFSASPPEAGDSIASYTIDWSIDGTAYSGTYTRSGTTTTHTPAAYNSATVGKTIRARVRAKDSHNLENPSAEQTVLILP